MTGDYRGLRELENRPNILRKQDVRAAMAVFGNASVIAAASKLPQILLQPILHCHGGT
jgi:hypothetical protein